MAHRRLILAIENKRADNGPRTEGIREVANESCAGGHDGQRARVAVRAPLFRLRTHRWTSGSPGTLRVCIVLTRTSST